MKTYVNTSNKGVLNMREEPRANAKVLAQIPYGTELEVTTTTTEWTITTYNGKQGYVMTKFLGDKKEITRSDLLKIYNSLSQTLQLIENTLK